MFTRTYISLLLILCLIWRPSSALADFIFLKNGKQLEVEKAWQEDDQVYFIYDELKASIPQSRVVRIESVEESQETSRKPDDPGNNVKSTARHRAPGASTLAALPRQMSSGAANPQKGNFARAAPALRPDGIGDLKWGLPAEGVFGLKPKQNDSGLKDVVEYIRPNDGLQIEVGHLTSIVYAFWRDQLYTVTLWTRGPSNYQALRQQVFKEFGQGNRPHADTEKHLWSMSATDMMLKYTEDDQYGFLWMRGKAMDRKFKLAQMSGQTSYLKWMRSRKK